MGQGVRVPGYVAVEVFKWVEVRVGGAGCVPTSPLLDQ